MMSDQHQHNWKLIGVELRGNSISVFSDVHWCCKCGAVKVDRKGKRPKRLYPKRWQKLLESERKERGE